MLAETVAVPQELAERPSAGLAPMLPEFRRLGRSGPDRTSRCGRGRGWPREGGNYLSFGVREFGMSAIANGMALHGGFTYVGTFPHVPRLFAQRAAHGRAQ